jgi:hypothetical protein
MFSKDELIESASEHLFPRLKSTSLTLHRFVDFDTEETVEIHHCPRKLIDKAPLFWQLSIENRSDFAPGDEGYRDRLIQDALCKPLDIKDVLTRYEKLRKSGKTQRFDDFLGEAGALVEALLMVESKYDWSVLCRTRREFAAIHWRISEPHRG